VRHGITRARGDRHSLGGAPGEPRRAWDDRGEEAVNDAIRLLTVFLLASAALASTARAESPLVPPSPLPLAWCVDRARVENPDVASDEAAAAAARERIDPAGSLEDPRIGYEASNLPVGDFSFTATPLAGNQLGIAQKLPFPGLLGNREEAARAGADAASFLLDDRRLRVSAAVESAWAALGFAQRALEITDQNLDLLRQLTRIAETKYSVGAGRQQDVLRAQVQVTRLLEERLEREARIRRAEAALAALLDLPPETSLPRTQDLADPAPVPSLLPLLDALEARSPLLQALDSQVEEAARRVRVAELEGYPDFDLNFGYRIRADVAGDPVAGDDFISAGIKIRLPVDRSKWRSHVAERGALLRRAEANYRSARAELRDAVRGRHADLERADAEVALLSQGLVPQTRQSLESSRAGYEVDKVDFLSLIDSQVSLLDAQLSLVRAESDRRAAFAALEAAVGEALR
jgi:cobalt-zinc-cadmium efflux system outer membrane protein